MEFFKSYVTNHQRCHLSAWIVTLKSLQCLRGSIACWDVDVEWCLMMFISSHPQKWIETYRNWIRMGHSSFIPGWLPTSSEHANMILTPSKNIKQLGIVIPFAESWHRRQHALWSHQSPAELVRASLEPCDYGGFHSHGGTQKLLLFFGENPVEMDDDWGYPYFRQPPNIVSCLSFKKKPP